MKVPIVKRAQRKIMRAVAPHNTKAYAETILNKVKAGKLIPAAITGFEPGEGGMVRQEISFELEPIAGRCITPIFAHVQSVFVPTAAMMGLKFPADQYADMAESIRQKLALDQTLFALGDGETPISQHLGIVPKRIANTLVVNEMPRLAYNRAVNFLRQQAYYKATEVSSTNLNVVPAIISETVLDRFNGVLDPDDRINGEVPLKLPNMNLPVMGTGPLSATVPSSTAVVIDQADGTNRSLVRSVSGTGIHMETDANGFPQVFAKLNAVVAGNINLADFYQIKELDKLVRTMDDVIKENPQFGQEMVLRWVRGLSVDAGPIPILMADRVIELNRATTPATDKLGVEADTMRTDYMGKVSIAIPVPTTELGGCLITLISIKPDETVEDQPHPFFTRPFKARNHAVDMMDLDAHSVLMRDLSADVPTAQETQVAFWTGLNALDQSYERYGVARQLPKNSVYNRTLMWNHALPLSVTPANVIYPDVFTAYPFADQVGDICTYVVRNLAAITTPQQFGPAPIEDLDVVDAIAAQI